MMIRNPEPLLEEHQGVHSFGLQTRKSQQNGCLGFDARTVNRMGLRATK